MTTSAWQLGAPTPTARGRSSRRWVGWATPAMLVLSVVLVGLVPASAGSSWRLVGAELRTLHLPWVLALTAVWWAGLYSHSLVLTASLPGLSSRRAIGLNLAGSSVANTLPLGGAISMALTSAMVTSWGFGVRALAAFFTVSTVANLVVRLLAGALGLVWLMTAWHGTAVADAAGWLALSVVLVLVVLGACLASDRSAAVLGATWARVRRRCRPAGANPPVPAHDALSAVRVRRLVLHLAERSWRRLSVGMVAYVVLLGLLLDLVLRALGSTVPWSLVLATVAVERLVTAVPVTPGGVGVAELVLAGCLSLGGTAPADAAAAALLYRVFTHLIEIPLGLLVTGRWGWARWRAAPRRQGARA